MHSSKIRWAHSEDKDLCNSNKSKLVSSPMPLEISSIKMQDLASKWAARVDSVKEWAALDKEWVVALDSSSSSHKCNSSRRKCLHSPLPKIISNRMQEQVSTK